MDPLGSPDRKFSVALRRFFLANSVSLIPWCSLPLASQSQASCRHTLLPLCQHIHLPTYQLCLLLALPPSVLLLRRRWPPRLRCLPNRQQILQPGHLLTPLSCPRRRPVNGSHRVLRLLTSLPPPGPSTFPSTTSLVQTLPLTTRCRIPSRSARRAPSTSQTVMSTAA